MTKEDWSYLVGVIQGDGYIRERSGGEIILTVGFLDLQYAEMLHNLIPNSTLRFDKSAIRVCFYGNNAKPFFGIKKDSLWTVPNNIIKTEWLAGLFDTDGGFEGDNRRQRISFYQKDNGNINHVYDALTELGINYSIQKRNARCSSNGIKSSSSITIRINNSYDVLLFNNLIKIRHNRKKDKLLKMISIAKLRKKLVVLSDEELLSKATSLFLQDNSISKIRYKLNSSYRRIKRLLEENINE